MKQVKATTGKKLVQEKFVSGFKRAVGPKRFKEMWEDLKKPKAEVAK